MLPALIVLDNRIAEVDASTVIEKLYAEERYRPIPVVVCSSKLSPALQKQLQAMGVYGCFEKGDNLEETLHLAKQLKQIAETKPVSPKAREEQER